MNKFLGDVRDVFFNNIKEKFKINKKFYILTNDADVFALKSLKKNKRFIDAGVAEQNLINIASGIAKNNKKPIVYGFCTFLTFRCYEQLRFNIGSHNLDVKVVGIGPGYSFSYDGPTHHGTQDIYLMYLIPEFEIFNISDNNLAYLISKNINKIKGPAYIRLDKGNLEYNTNVKYNLDKGFELTSLAKIKKILIITTGYFCQIANNVSLDLNYVAVLNLFKFKNFDKKKFLKTVKEYENIIIFDENSKNGGITAILSNIFIENNLNLKIKILASKDIQSFFYYQKRDIFLKKLNLNKTKLKKIISRI
jgi:transketolase